MKKAKKWWLTKVNFVLAWITAQLGLVSCDNNILDIGGGGLCMYGMPTADYTLSLKVKDEAGKPIANQKVLVRPTDDKGQIDDYHAQYIQYETDTVTTDQDGKYEGAIGKHSYGRYWFPGIKGMRVVVEDPVDPMLAPDSVTVSVKQTKKGDGDWYEGTYGGNAELTLKKKEN